MDSYNLENISSKNTSVGPNSHAGDIYHGQSDLIAAMEILKEATQREKPESYPQVAELVAESKSAPSAGRIMGTLNALTLGLTDASAIVRAAENIRSILATWT